MRPLICFYENEKYFYSEDYSLQRCGENEDPSSFLTRVKKDFADQVKIVQINFEALHESLFIHQAQLYPSAKASVFILNQYETIGFTEILSRLHSFRNEDFKLNRWIFLESEEQFKNKIKSIQKDISKGRLYQVNLTSALKTETTLKAENIFCNLNSYFNGDYKALLPLTDIHIISFSPELFLKKQNDLLWTQPIKGSLPDSIENTDTLLKSSKEEAELSMIVDLLRNDLNHLEENSSAVVRKHRDLMKLNYIQHTYSEILIKTQKDLPEVLKSCWPGGSISGCPKIESLLVIAEHESIKRQVYTGAIGWWKDNDFCLNLSIRTFIQHKKELFYHAGCGIVYDSVAENEWQEFLLKTGRLQS